MKKIIKSVVLASLIFLVLFLTIGLNIIRNITNDSLSESLMVSVPVGTEDELNNTSVNVQDIIGSYITSNQTQTVADLLQNDVLSNVIVETPDESQVILTVEKINSVGTIVDRFEYKLANLLNVATNGQSLPDLTKGKLRLSLEFQSKQSSTPVKLSGSIKVSINDSEYVVKPVSIQGDSGFGKSKLFSIDGNTFYDILLEPSNMKLNVGMNKITVSFVVISGNMGVKTINRNNVLIYESVIEYSPILKIFVSDESVKNIIYPNGDSSISFSSVGSRYVALVPSSDMCPSINNRFSYQPCYYTYPERISQPVVVKGVMVKNVKTGEVLLDVPELKDTVSVNIQRNSEFYITIQEPPSSWKIQTPAESSVKYSYSCVSKIPDYETDTSQTVICGHS